MDSPKRNIEDSLLAKYLDGSTSPSETAEVEAWLGESAENKAVFDHFKTIWMKSQAVAFDSEVKFDKKAAFENVMKRIEQASEQPEIVQKPTKPSIFTLLIRLAAFIIFGISCYFIYENYIKSEREIMISSITESKEILMPDSSLVSLNTAGEIKYAENFAQKRELTLRGEAFFEVKNQENQAFIVQAEDLEVSVLGTSFYIIAYENDSIVEVGVKTGSVEVDQRSGTKSVILKANEMLKYNKNDQSFNLSEKYSNNKLFWKTGVLEFNEKPLSEVFSTLSQVFSKEINYRQSELENCRFSGRFKDAGLEEILKQLQISFDFEMNMEEEINISGKPCEK